MLDAGIIRRSHSPFASNIELVRKKDNSLRICTDFRSLNSRTIIDAYSLLRVDEILEALSGSKYFSVLDIKSGYHQVEIERSRKKERLLRSDHSAFSNITACRLAYQMPHHLPTADGAVFRWTTFKNMLHLLG